MGGIPRCHSDLLKGSTHITVEDFVRGPLRQDLLGDFSSIHLPFLGCTKPGVLIPSWFHGTHGRSQRYVLEFLKFPSLLEQNSCQKSDDFDFPHGGEG